MRAPRGEERSGDVINGDGARQVEPAEVGQQGWGRPVVQRRQGLVAVGALAEMMGDVHHAWAGETAGNEAGHIIGQDRPGSCCRADGRV